APVVADVGGDVLGGAVGRGQGRDAKDRDGCLDAGGLAVLADGPEGGAFDEERLAHVLEAQIWWGVGDLDGANLVAAVAAFLDAVADWYVTPVDRVEAVEQVRLVLLRDHDDVDAVVVAERDVVALRVQRVHGGHPAVEVEASQQRPKPGDLVAFLVDLALSEGDPNLVVEGRQQADDIPIGVDGASQGLAVDCEGGTYRRLGGRGGGVCGCGWRGGGGAGARA